MRVCMCVCACMHVCVHACMWLEGIILQNTIFSDSGFRWMKASKWGRHSSLGEQQVPWLRGISGTEARPGQSRKLTERLSS